MSMMAMAQQLANQGRGDDTILAHITREEAQLLKDRGGSGTINPVTGLPEFANVLTKLWNGVKKAVKTIAPVIIPAIAIFYPPLIPAIGTYLGASAATASVVGAAALSAGVTLASGGSLKEVLTSAALAGTSAYFTPIVGKMVTPTGASQLTQVLAGSAAIGAGYTAARGGTVKEMLAAAATGAASAYVTNIMSTAYAKMNNMMASGRSGTITQKGATDASFLAADATNLKAAGLSETQIAQTLKATGVDALTADFAAAQASAGMAADDLATNLAANRPAGLYTGEANTKAIIGGNNEQVVQRVEDANFVAKDAADLAKQGLSQAQIKDNLMASGVDANVANTVSTLAKQGLTNTQIADSLVNSNSQTFLSNGKVFTNTTDTIARDIGVAMNSEQTAAYKALPYKDLVNSGAITIDEANVLSQQGVTSQQVQDLTKLGYTGSDISDMVGAGVKVTDLTNLAKTQFSESTINDLLMGGRTVNDISQASTAINNKSVSLDTATKLLEKGVSGTTITRVASTKAGNADAFNSLLDKGLSANNAYDLATKGYDLTKVNSLVDSGKLNATTLNDTIGKGNYSAWLNSQMATTPTTNQPTQPTTPVAPTTVSQEQQILNTGLVDSTQAAVLDDAGYTGNQVKSLINAGYTAADLTELASTGVTANTLTNLATTRFPEATINDMLMKGISANDIGFASNMVNVGATSQANAEKILNSGATGTSAGGQLSTMLNNGNVTSKLLDAGLSLNDVNTVLGKGSSYATQVANNPGQYGYGANPVQPTQPTQTQPTQPTTPVSPNQPVNIETQIANTGLVDSTQASVLAENGFTANEVKSLINAGYTAGDLTDLASTGVRPATLTSLAQTRFNEATINDLLMKGVSANDIGFASSMVNVGATSQANAEKILNSGATGTTSSGQLAQMLNNGNLAVKMLDSGMNTTDIGTVLSKGSSYATQVANDPVKFGYVQPAPYDVKSTGLSDSAPGTVYNGPNGPEVVLNNGKTVSLAEYQAAIDSGKPISIDGNMTTSGEFKVEVGGAPKFAGMSGAGQAPSGFKVATPQDVFGPNDTNSASNPYTQGAYYDANTNTWFVPDQPVVPPITPTVPEVPEITVTAPGTPPVITPPIAPIVPSTPPATPTTPPKEEEQVVTPPVPPVAPPVETPPVVTPPVTPPVVTPPVEVPPVVTPPVTPTPEVPTIDIVAPKEPPVVVPPIPPVVPPVTPTPEVPELTITAPKEEPPIVVPPVPPVVPPVTPTEPEVPELVITEPKEPPVVPPVIPPVTPEPPVVEPPEEEPPIVIPPIPPVVPDDEAPGTPFFRPPVLPSIGIKPLEKGGLNPGYITDVPDFYNTTNSAQSKYYWGRHPYQPGPTFDEQLYNTAPQAPSQPFGIQNMATNMMDYNQLLQMGMGQQPPMPQTTQPASPVNPQYQQYNSTVPFTQPIVPQMVGTVPYNPMLSYEEYNRSLTDPNYVPNQPVTPVAPVAPTTTANQNVVRYQPFMTYQQYRDSLVKTP